MSKPVIERRCDACGIRSTQTEIVFLTGPPIVPGTGHEIPPYVCADFKGCVKRFTTERTRW